MRTPMEMQMRTATGMPMRTGTAPPAKSAQSQLFRQVAEPVELPRRDEPRHRQVRLAWLEILAQGQHVAVLFPQITHYLLHLIQFLTHPQHQPGLGLNRGVQLFELGQQGEGLPVIGSGARFAVEAWDSLQVMIEYIRRLVGELRQRLFSPPPEVRHQDLDAGVGSGRTQRSYAGGIVGRPAVAQVVAVDRCDHHVAQLHCLHGLSQVSRFLAVQRARFAVGHIAEGTAAGADIPHDHERGGSMGEAFTQVGTGCFLADRAEVALAQDAFDPRHLLAARDPGGDT